MKAILDMTRDELRAEAKEREIVGRGKMSKEQLKEAISWARAGDSVDTLTVSDEPPGVQAWIAPLGTPETEMLADRYTVPAEDMARAILDSNRRELEVVRNLYATEPARPQPTTMSNARRISNYMKQNGTNKLTVRQARQVRKMAKRGALDI